jgi:hypothetical protein
MHFTPELSMPLFCMGNDKESWRSSSRFFKDRIVLSESLIRGFTTDHDVLCVDLKVE